MERTLLTWADDFALRLSAQLLLRLVSPDPPRRRKSRPAPPPLPYFPPQFQSYAEWKAWCAQDQEDEMREALVEHTVADWEADAFARQHSEPAQVIEFPRAA